MEFLRWHFAQAFQRGVFLRTRQRLGHLDAAFLLAAFAQSAGGGARGAEEKSTRPDPWHAADGFRIGGGA